MNLNNHQLLQVLNCLTNTKNELFAFDFRNLSQNKNTIKSQMILYKNE